MRGYLPSYEMRRARTLEEALELVAQQPVSWRPFAGGTDLMVLLGAGALPHHRYVSLWGIPDLRRIDLSPDEVAIGALATFTDLRRHDALCREFPLLSAAAREIGGVANQNRGTLGGNIANASPAADAPPALLVYDAELEIVSARGERRVPYAAFHTGYKQMALAPDELIARIRLPRPGPFGAPLAAPGLSAVPASDGTRVQYRKVGARLAQAISKVCFAGGLRVADGRIADIRLAFGSVAPTVLRARRTEGVLAGATLDAPAIELAVETLITEIAPIDDLRSTARYRMRVAGNLLRRFLESTRPVSD